MRRRLSSSRGSPPATRRRRPGSGPWGKSFGRYELSSNPNPIVRFRENILILHDALFSGSLPIHGGASLPFGRRRTLFSAPIAIIPRPWIWPAMISLPALKSGISISPGACTSTTALPGRSPVWATLISFRFREPRSAVGVIIAIPATIPNVCAASWRSTACSARVATVNCWRWAASPRSWGSRDFVDPYLPNVN